LKLGRIKPEAIKKNKKNPTQSEQYQNLIDEPWKTEAKAIPLTQTYMTTHCLGLVQEAIPLTQTYMTTHCLGFVQALKKVLKGWCVL
jgi:hypothetical protein